jgi:RNA polymerase-associated protein RTF1
LYRTAEGSEEEDDDDDDEELEDDDDDDETPEGQTIRVAHRGGGKSLMRMRPEEEEEEESEEEEEDQTPVRVVQRGGGKMLSMLRPPPNEDGDDDDEEEDEDEETEEPAPVVVKPVQRGGGKSLYSSPGGGKQLRRPEPEEEEEPARTTIRAAVGGGKQLRPPPAPKEVKAEEPTRISRTATTVNQAPRGKQLRRPTEEKEPEKEVLVIDDSDDDDDVEMIEAPPAPSPPKPAPIKPAGRGKQLRLPEPEEPEKPPTKITRSPAGGKQLRRPEPEVKEEKKAPVKKTPVKKAPAKKAPVKKPPAKKAVVTRSPRGGKQLSRPSTAKESESEDDFDDDDDDEDEELFDDGDDDDEEEEESDYDEAPAKKPKGKAPPGRPRRAAAAKKVVEADTEIFGDDDMSSDDEEMELDENNTEALIQDEDDRKHLESLPELEREAILADRFEKLKAEQDMKKVLREAKRRENEKAGKTSGATKRKAAAPAKKTAKKSKVETDEDLARKLAGAGKRESQRDKDATGAKSKKAAALAALKKSRKIQKQKEDDGESEDDFFDDSEDSDDDYDGGVMPWQEKKATSSRLDQGDSDEEPVEKSKRKSKPAADSGAPVVEANLEDFIKVTVPRRRLARWCNEPFFQASVLECFVRLFIGEDEKGDKCYRLCEIIDVNVGVKTYMFPVANKKEKPISTNKTLRLKFGNSERDFPMSLVSNAPPEEQDVLKYISVQKNLRQEVLSKRRANQLRRLQDNLINNYTYTTEDIEKNLAVRRKQGKSMGNMGAEQTKASIAVQGARDALEEAKTQLEETKKKMLEASDTFDEAALGEAVEDAEKAVEDCKKNLRETEEEANRTLDIVGDRKRRLQQNRKDRNWANVNQRAIRANQRTDRHATKEHEIKEARFMADFNPYARRKVKPKILWEVGQDEKGDEKKKEAEGAKATIPTATAVVESIAAPSLVQEPSEQAPAPTLSESHQFTIDEEALAKDSLSFLPSRSNKTTKRVRKGLSLAVYLERKANGTL